MVGCAILGCNNSTDMGYSFYEISDRRRTKLRWLEICGLPKSTHKYARLCEGHFSKDQFEVVDNMGKAKLKPSACPSKLSPNPDRVLNTLACSSYKLDSKDENGGGVFVHEQTSFVRVLDGMTSQSTDRAPIKDVTKKANVNEQIDQNVAEVAKNVGEGVPVFETEQLQLVNVLHEPDTKTTLPSSSSENITDEGKVAERLVLYKGQPLTVEDLLERVNALKEENRQLEKRNSQLEKDCSQLENDKNSLTVKVHDLEMSKSQLVINIKKLFNHDQLQLLELANPSTNTRKWSPITLKKAIIVRLIAKSRGYEKLRKFEGWPLPALCVINRKLQMLDFAPGNFGTLLKLLGDKIVAEKNQCAKFAVLSLDEMVITPRCELDKGLRSYTGFVSPEIAISESEKCSLATHVMAFVVRGLTVHWKQLVTYLLTGNSVNSIRLGNFIDVLIKALHQVGIIVVAVSTDMGGANQGMWSSKGVKFSRQEVNPKVRHPCPSEDAEELLYSSDIPHAMKNLWAQLLRRLILMPENWAASHNITSRVVSASHVKDFMDAQGRSGLVLVPNLKDSALDPGRFEKMRVPIALSFFNKKLGKAMLTLINQGLLSQECEATAWFIIDVARWYEIMSSRSCTTGLHNNDRGREAVAFLKSFMTHVQGMQFFRVSNGTRDGQWKPIQSAILLGTSVVLNLWHRFVASGKLKYLLCSRLFTSGCENLFSQLRSYGDVHPPPRQVRRVLRLISVAQYLRSSSMACYEDDDEPYYIDFLSGKVLDRAEDWAFSEEEVDEFVDLPYEEFTRVGRMSLYYLAGWVVSCLKGVCPTCDIIIASDSPLPHLPAEFTNTVSEGFLSHPTYFVWTVVTNIEDVFNQKSSKLLQKKNVKEFLIACSKKKAPPCNATCHDVHHNVAGKFISLRLHILGADVSKGTVQPMQFNSASAYMRTAAQYCKDQSNPSSIASPQILAKVAAAASNQSVLSSPVPSNLAVVPCTPMVQRKELTLRRLLL